MERTAGEDRQAHAYSLDVGMAMFGRVRTLREVEAMLGTSAAGPHHKT